MNKVKEYILKHYDECIKENKSDDGTLIGLPYPYTVPAVGHFNELYYWDTYFINKGLLVSDRLLQAKNNTLNMFYLIDKYGYMPNGNRTYYIGRSQPPFLSDMVRDIYDICNDSNYLKKAYKALKKEYEFWMNNRILPIGLNAYGGKATSGNYIAEYQNRVGVKTDEDPKSIEKHCILSCESGWDMSPRWKSKGYNFAHVDLNSLMYMAEINIAYFAHKLNDNEEEKYLERAQKRKELMNKYMKRENKVLYDYDFVNDSYSSILSAASFYPLFAKAADENEADEFVSELLKLETKWGILTCEKNEEQGIYQWNYPNGWACLQYIAVKGLCNYGYIFEAKRIAKKFMKLIESVFEKTNNLWEKYNVVDGSIDVNDEYKMPPMMGWTAGVYLSFCNFLENDEEKL